MRESTIDRIVLPIPHSRDLMTQMIQQEVDDWPAERAGLLDEQGRRQVVRNGFLPKRKITTGVG